ncbi:MAG: 23S rRNA (pseudouridine(1915)-N(3))-methyltransferase RlmH [Thermodesulfobacteriota bacterium]
MQIELLFLGKTKEKYLAVGIEDFAARLKRFAKVNIKVLKDVKPVGKPDLKIKDEEGKVLLNHLHKRTFLIALDPGGKVLSSEGLAKHLGNWRDSGRNHITLVLGGSLGLGRGVLDRADLILSLSKLTFTHEMARLIIMEQLYRAFNILAGTGYHK